MGQETAEAWLAILARPRVPHPAWYTDPVADRALYWFDEALAQVFDGAAPASALAEAQEKASAFVGCIEENGEDDQAWRTCVRRADPAVVLPDR